MAYKIIRTKTFIKNVVSINTYLQNKWNLKVAIDFQLKLNEQEALLSVKPNIGAAVNKNNLRKLLITKHNRLYYRIDEDKGTITLLTLFDTRQDPKISKFDKLLFMSSKEELKKELHTLIDSIEDEDILNMLH